MSIYTTKFQYLVREYGQPQDNLITKIDLMRRDFFNFEYAVPESVNVDEFRQYFERLFITHFFNDEFAYETVDYFKLQLMSKMWEVMPTYAQRLNILYTITRDTFFNETHTHSNGTSVNGERKITNFNGERKTTNLNGERKTTNLNGERKTTNDNGQRVTDVDSTDVSSDLPINMITTTDIDNVNYASYGKKDKSKTTQQQVTDTTTIHQVTDTTTQESVTDTTTQESVTDTTTQESVTDTNESDTHTISGNLFQYLGQYNKEIAPLISELLDEFEPLFMWVW